MTGTLSKPHRIETSVMLAALRQAHAAKGDQKLSVRRYGEVRQRDRMEGAWPHATSILERFGTWSAALTAAGVP